MVEYCTQEHNIQRNIILALLDPISKERDCVASPFIITTLPCLSTPLLEFLAHNERECLEFRYGLPRDSENHFFCICKRLCPFCGKHREENRRRTALPNLTYPKHQARPKTQTVPPQAKAFCDHHPMKHFETASCRSPGQKARHTFSSDSPN